MAQASLFGKKKSVHARRTNISIPLIPMQISSFQMLTTGLSKHLVGQIDVLCAGGIRDDVGGLVGGDGGMPGV